MLTIFLVSNTFIFKLDDFAPFLLILGLHSDILDFGKIHDKCQYKNIKNKSDKMITKNNQFNAIKL